MGTRADFYVGIRKLEWLGSIGYDGYEEGISKNVLEAKSIKAFKEALQKFFKRRDDVTTPELGWPWPWGNSDTTDYSYVFNPKRKKVFVHCYGGRRKWPDMSKLRQRLPIGDIRSGIILLEAK